MPFRAYCRIPEKPKGSVRKIEGSSPQLLYDLMEELKGAIEINIATYLFNNPLYVDFLVRLASTGTKISITTLPPMGYNNRPKTVDGLGDRVSARQLAVEAFNRLEATKNITLSFFPHQYVWYGALYAGGGASYSFHVKAISALFDGGLHKCILSSGNFLSTDPYHSDNILVIDGEEEYSNSFIRFFTDLASFSIGSEAFKGNFTNYADEFLVQFHGRERDIKHTDFENCFFTAPFYLVDGVGSNHYAGNKIIELIQKAKTRIWVCAQHFHDIISFDQERSTIIKALYDKSISEPNIEYRFLKQVPHSSLADKRRAGIAETLFKFVMKADQRYNRLTHDKFIIADNTLLISTANYTSTQFAFGARKMDFKDEANVKHRKTDNFAEVNGFAIIPNCPENLLQTYKTHFNSLWDSGQEIELKI